MLLLMSVGIVVAIIVVVVAANGFLNWLDDEDDGSDMW